MDETFETDKGYEGYKPRAIYGQIVRQVIAKLSGMRARAMNIPTSPEGPWSCRISEAAELLAWLDSAPEELLNRARFDGEDFIGERPPIEEEA